LPNQPAKAKVAQQPRAVRHWANPGIRFSLMLVLAALILAAHRDIYWRAFDGHPQESTVSFHAYGFAAANGAGLGSNPLVARHIDIRESRIEPYNHWPNGFFLFFEAVLRIFGRTESAGRWVAILGTLAGFTLVIVSVGRQDFLIYAVLPLLLLSAAGRDSIGFVFLDVALHFFLGVLLWITAYLGRHRYYNWMFRFTMIAALLFNHLIAPYAAMMILLKWRESRSARGLLVDFAVLGAGFAAVLLALAAGFGDLRAGAGELLRIFQVRASAPAANWLSALYEELRTLFHIGPAGVLLVAVSWALCVWRREWRTAALIPSFLLFTILLREYVARHHFARLPFVLFSLLTVAVAFELVIARLPRFRHGARAAAIVLLAVVVGAGKQQYEINLGMQVGRAALVRLVSDPRQQPALAQCNAFTFQPDIREEDFDPFGLMGQFFFGPQVVRRIVNGDPIRRCTVDLERAEIRLTP
jgi:hypothetical protein